MACELIEKNINCPATCSSGRLFDGVAAILGLTETVSAEAEAAMLLEEAAFRGVKGRRDDGWAIPLSGTERVVIPTQSIVEHIVTLRRAGAGVDETAYAFHAALARTAVETARRIREESGLNDVALSGGAFQNRLLLGLIIDGLREKRFDIHLPKKIPFNDGCIALGQIAVARELLYNE